MHQLIPLEPWQFFLLHWSTVMMGLVVLAFGLVAPWYRSFSGVVLFLVKLGYFGLLLVITLAYYLPLEHPVRDFIRLGLYPLTSFTSAALLFVILRAQWAGRRKRRIDEAIFTKNPEVFPLESEKEDGWDGSDRRVS